MFVISLKIKKIIIPLCISISIFLCFLVYAKFSPDKPESIEVPIIMYHHILKDESRLGKYVISVDEFKKDLDYLTEKGYETVLVRDLVDFVYNKKAIPKKSVILSFDDGYESNYSYVYPILKEKNKRMVLSIIGKYSDEYTISNDSHINYAHVKWPEIKEMSDSGLVEIANHTYNCHKVGERKGIKKISGESENNYKKLLYNDVVKLNDEIYKKTGIKPCTFTYPFGYTDKETSAMINELGFLSTLSCEEGKNIITRGDDKCLYLLKRYNRPHNVNRESFFKKMGIE